MSTENEISADDRQEMDFPALVEAVTHQVLKNVALALISEGTAPAGQREPAAEPPEEVSFYEEVRRFEIKLITQALSRTQGKQSEAARLLGLKATTLNSKMKQYQMRAERKGSDSARLPRDAGGSRSASA
jgi:DNA-binding NtrC family response regulator